MATAAGCQLVAACDLAVAADSARFATPGVKIGLFCSTPMVPLSRAIGRKRALDMLLTGRPIDAATALDWGLVNRVVASRGAGRRGRHHRRRDRALEPAHGRDRQGGVLRPDRARRAPRLRPHQGRHGDERARRRRPGGHERLPGEAPAGVARTLVRAAQRDTNRTPAAAAVAQAAPLPVVRSGRELGAGGAAHLLKEQQRFGPLAFRPLLNFIQLGSAPAAATRSQSCLSAAAASHRADGLNQPPNHPARPVRSALRRTSASWRCERVDAGHDEPEHRGERCRSRCCAVEDEQREDQKHRDEREGDASAVAPRGHASTLRAPGRADNAAALLLAPEESGDLIQRRSSRPDCAPRNTTRSRTVAVTSTTRGNQCEIDGLRAGHPRMAAAASGASGGRRRASARSTSYAGSATIRRRGPPGGGGRSRGSKGRRGVGRRRLTRAFFLVAASRAWGRSPACCASLSLSRRAVAA